jgi:hypothetical protein
MYVPYLASYITVEHASDSRAKLESVTVNRWPLSNGSTVPLAGPLNGNGTHTCEEKKAFQLARRDGQALYITYVS